MFCFDKKWVFVCFCFDKSKVHSDILGQNPKIIKKSSKIREVRQVRGVGGTLKSKMSFKNLIFEEISTSYKVTKKIEDFSSKTLEVRPLQIQMVVPSASVGGDGDKPLTPFFLGYDLLICIV